MISRRGFVGALGLLIAAPAIVKAESLMRLKSTPRLEFVGANWQVINRGDRLLLGGHTLNFKRGANGELLGKIKPHDGMGPMLQIDNAEAMRIEGLCFDSHRQPDAGNFIERGGAVPFFVQHNMLDKIVPWKSPLLT